MKKEKKIKLIAVLGKSGAGKDTVCTHIAYQFHISRLVLTTTRPPRDYEVEGKDYYFLSKERFLPKCLIGVACFNGWYYGLDYSTLDPDTIYVGVLNPRMYEAIKDDPRFEVLPFYVYATAATRIKRSLKREEHPDVKEIWRRYWADKKDFEPYEKTMRRIFNDIDTPSYRLDIPTTWRIHDFLEAVKKN